MNSGPRLIKAACPNCGAGVAIDPNSEWVTCSYCRTSSFIDRPRRDGAPRVAPPPNTPTIHLPAEQPPQGLAAHPVLAGALALLLVTGALVAFWTMSRRVDGPASGPMIIVGGPILGDANADGVADPIVRYWTRQDDRPRLAALDGRSGIVIWTTEPLAPTAPGRESPLSAVAGDKVLVAHGAELLGFTLSSGKHAFRVTLPERVKGFCELPGGGAGLWMKDDRMAAIDLSTGALSPRGHIAGTTLQSRLAKGRGRDVPPDSLVCALLHTDDSRSYGPGVEDAGIFDLDVDEIAESDTLAYGGAPPYLLVGTRPQGTRVPRIGAHDGTKLLWFQDVPAADSINAREGAPDATLARGRAFVAYTQERPQTSLHIASFDMQTGKRLWETALPGEHDIAPHLISSDRHLFVVSRWRLIAFSATDGRKLYDTAL